MFRSVRIPLLALVCALPLAFGACKRRGHHARASKPAPPASTSTLASTTASTSASVTSWAGKRLHVWITSCDTASPETTQILTQIAARRTVVDSVGLACQLLKEDGSFVAPGEGPKGRGRAAIVTKLAALGIETSLLVANPGPGGFDGPLAVRVLEKPEARTKLATSLVEVARKEQHAAIELDLEAMASSAAPNYASLAREVATKAGPKLGLAVDVHPKTVDDPGWEGPGGHDYGALANAGAIVRLMTYDLSIGPVPPGPGTKASWVIEVVAYAKSKGVKPSQLEIGLPAYGYDFSPQGKSAPVPLKHREVMALLARTKAKVERTEEGTPHFAYDGHEVWYDDAESLQRLLRALLVVAPDVRGVAIWGLGGADPELLPMLERLGF